MTNSNPVSADATKVTGENLVASIRHAIETCRAKSTNPDVVLTLHGLTIRLHCKNKAFLGHCLNHIVNDPSFAMTSQKTIDIHVTSPEDGLLGPPPLWGEETYQTPRIEAMLETTPVRASYYDALGLWHVYDHESATGLQWMQNPVAYPPWESAGPLRIFMHWALSMPQSRLVHAGTLGQDGKAVLMVGRGGSGKSSTVVAGIAHQMQSAGDDYVHVRHDAGRTNVYPVFSVLKQDAAGLNRLGLFDIPARNKANWQAKYEFGAPDVGGLPMTGPLAVKAILIPVIGNRQDTSITPASKKEAMLALAPSTVLQMPGERISGMAFFADLVRRLPCHRLTLGSDPVGIVSAIRNFLEAQK